MASYNHNSDGPINGLSELKQRYLYRALRPNEDFQQDLFCVAPHSKRTINQHIASGLTNPSRFISTTTDLECAIDWAATADQKTSEIYGNERTVIVKIDIKYLKKYYPNVYYEACDLTLQCNIDHYLTSEKQENYAAAYQEVLFVDWIPKGAVSVETILESVSESDTETGTETSSDSEDDSQDYDEYGYYSNECHYEYEDYY
ncbi:hypothetical protein LOD99_10649 [Oopsacas minuta]|uniref:DUF7587 domain-containing protein n=1 Tax=Oopsacas minuta TaxID=111878 RepID=A0AAV7KI08_9METZ|nr:hypothetical protein LOD99_10649 [Oopsacas minuta]